MIVGVEPIAPENISERCVEVPIKRDYVRAVLVLLIAVDKHALTSSGGTDHQ